MIIRCTLRHTEVFAYLLERRRKAVSVAKPNQEYQHTPLFSGDPGHILYPSVYVKRRFYNTNHMFSYCQGYIYGSRVVKKIKQEL